MAEVAKRHFLSREACDTCLLLMKTTVFLSRRRVATRGDEIEIGGALFRARNGSMTIYEQEDVVKKTLL